MAARCFECNGILVQPNSTFAQNGRHDNLVRRACYGGMHCSWNQSQVQHCGAPHGHRLTPTCVWLIRRCCAARNGAACTEQCTSRAVLLPVLMHDCRQSLCSGFTMTDFPRIPVQEKDRRCQRWTPCVSAHKKLPPPMQATYCSPPLEDLLLRQEWGVRHAR